MTGKAYILYIIYVIYTIYLLYIFAIYTIHIHIYIYIYIYIYTIYYKIYAKMRPFFACQLLCISYYDCVMNATAWKVKVANMFVMLITWCKIQEKKLLQTTIHLRKWIQLKVFNHPVNNVWMISLFLILIFWWIELAVLKSLP